jgi:Retinal pigment epithelial membrane protein
MLGGECIFVPAASAAAAATASLAEDDGYLLVFVVNTKVSGAAAIQKSLPCCMSLHLLLHRVTVSIDGGWTYDCSLLARSALLRPSW